MKFFIVLFAAFSLQLFSQTIDEIGISVNNPGRQFVYTNKEAGTYHGEVLSENTGGWQGWFVNAEKIFHDYRFESGGVTFDRSNARSVVYPHQLVRTFPGGITETMTLLDSVDVLLIEVTGADPQLSLIPADAFVQDTTAPLSHRRWSRRAVPSSLVPNDIVVVQRRRKHTSIFAVAAGINHSVALSSAEHAARHPEEFLLRRKKRMQNLLSHSRTETSDRELTIALAWAKLQADALIMNQSTGGARTRGIFAGLPWFNNYWGRDSFISLPGATYVTGNFSDAQEILRSYAAFQETDSTDSNFGRIPNLATPQSVIYNTADGTPWFVKSLYEYVKYSGDIPFIREMYPVIVRSIDGTLKYHSDSLGFLTHGDAESWMDAVGPNGPWSPRGNRAVDIQALWHQQLMIGVFSAEYFNDFHRAARWSSIAERLEQNFRQYFVDTAGMLLHDHLNTSGIPSTELRPNQLFALDMAIPEQVRKTMVAAVLKELVYPYGTATLNQADSLFHPYHENPPFYVKDAAYHNGTIWTWLNGMAIYGATRYDLQDLIYPVTKNSVHQMLRRGTVGTLSECLDAFPRIGDTGVQHPDDQARLSGTYSQAWSLAEFIRSMYQDYFGVSVDVPSNVIRVQPKLPSDITYVAFEQRVGTGSVSISYRRTGDSLAVMMTPKNLSEKFGISYLWVYGNGDAVFAPVELYPDKILRLSHTRDALQWHTDAELTLSEKNNPRIFLKNFSDKKYFRNVSLAQADTSRVFPVLRGPSHPLLSHAEVKSINHSAVLLAESADPAGDDNGISGTYRYPSSQHFKQGILDITGASFRYDETSLYCTLQFSDLYDPGWHPEYGFQLTFAAIAIQTSSGSQQEIGANAQYRLPPDRAYDRLILVGGGIRLLDGAGTIVCEYIPKQTDISNPLGSVSEKKIEFSLPLEYLGIPNPRWKFTIAVGAQDDHGGAGIGEFRAVARERSEWTGGGKIDQNESNVYDVMVIH